MTGCAVPGSYVPLSSGWRDILCLVRYFHESIIRPCYRNHDCKKSGPWPIGPSPVPVDMRSLAPTLRKTVLWLPPYGLPPFPSNDELKETDRPLGGMHPPICAYLPVLKGAIVP